MEHMQIEGDAYVDQLHSVFDEFDVDGKGHLDRAELRLLCARLAVEDQTEALERQLLGGKNEEKVTFEVFKEGFVSVLSQSAELLESESDEDTDDESHIDLLYSTSDNQNTTPTKRHPSNTYEPTVEEESPSKDDLAISISDLSEENDDISDNEDKKDESLHGASQGTNLCSAETARTISPSTPPPVADEPVAALIHSETYEAEDSLHDGQLDQSIGDMENALDPVSEEEHLRDIWKELGVGVDGYLTVDELAKVCTHIGMEEMDAEELQQLFDKLDVDLDGRVSFREFLEGLFQHGGSTTPSNTPIRPSSTPRQKLRFSVPLEDRAQTPSFVSSGCGLFSTLDVDGNGYAKPEAVIELWETLGIPQGAEILEYFGFDLTHKLNLGDLSFSLEQEMHTVEEDNAAYHAAVASYQHELRHLKTVSDHMADERNKLKQDLSEATTRITNLVKEGDDRYSTLERSKEKEINELNRKYLEQIKNLHSEYDREHEVQLHQNTKKKKVPTATLR